MEECKPVEMNTGLRGVTIASTKVSDVRGAEGKLIYRGYLVQDLAKNATFEEVIHLLLHEHLPNETELAGLKKVLAKERAIPDRLVSILKASRQTAVPMDILQAAVPLLATCDPDLDDPSRPASERKAVRLIAKLPTVLAAWERIRKGKEPIAPSANLSQAANFLYMLTGERPDEETARFFDICLILHAEHSFNASTFAAREIASTRAHMYAAVSGAIGSLSGELHGGANVRVMQMLKKIDSIDNVETYVNNEFDAGRKVFGLGHAVYDTDDPRAFILAPMSSKVGRRIGEPKWYDISKKIEEVAKASFKERKGKDIYVNVDFYSASLYHAMRIPMDFFTPVFAISRVAGWCAHVLEEQFAEAAPKPMLYRPESEYVGDYCGPDECSFVPVDNR